MTHLKDALRPSVRWVRKRGKRLYAGYSTVVLDIQNRWSSVSLLGDVPVVVSLTTYGTRLSRVHLALESMARGRSKPSRVILWLDDPQTFATPPKALERLTARGLELRLTDDLGPHKKYYPYASSEQHHALPLITADDDVVYPRYWLQRLFQSYIQHPEVISCYWANEMRVQDHGFDEYSRWTPCRTTTPRRNHFAVGVSGVLYPPPMLDALAGHGTAFLAVSPRADDIWLHWVALRSGFLIRQISRTPRHFPLIPGSQDNALVVQNVGQQGNDRRIEALYTEQDRILLTGT